MLGKRRPPPSLRRNDEHLPRADRLPYLIRPRRITRRLVFQKLVLLERRYLHIDELLGSQHFRQNASVVAGFGKDRIAVLELIAVALPLMEEELVDRRLALLQLLDFLLSERQEPIFNFITDKSESSLLRIVPEAFAISLAENTAQ